MLPLHSDVDWCMPPLSKLSCFRFWWWSCYLDPGHSASPSLFSNEIIFAQLTAAVNIWQGFTAKIILISAEKREGRGKKSEKRCFVDIYLPPRLMIDKKRINFHNQTKCMQDQAWAPSFYSSPLISYCNSQLSRLDWVEFLWAGSTWSLFWRRETIMLMTMAACARYLSDDNHWSSSVNAWQNWKGSQLGLWSGDHGKKRNMNLSDQLVGTLKNVSKVQFIINPYQIHQRIVFSTGVILLIYSKFCKYNGTMPSKYRSSS